MLNTPGGLVASLSAKLALLEGADQNQLQNLYKLEKTANQDRQPPVINAAPAKVFPSDEEDRQVHGSTEAQVELHESPGSNRNDAGADGAGSADSATTSSDRSHVAASAANADAAVLLPTAFELLPNSPTKSQS